MPVYPWHEAQWRLLQGARTTGRLAHALLIAGSPGLGKRAFAERIARSLLCRAVAADGEPCGQCRACRFFAAGTHPDFRRIEPEEEGKPIRIETIREFNAWSVMTPQEGQHRVTVIIPADRMNTAAANSLLKTLEEPVAGNHILLVTARPAALPATVRSRCHRVAFQPPPAAEAEAWLRREAGEGPWPLLLRLARYAPLEAVRLAREQELPRRAAVFDDFQGLWSARRDPLGVAANWAEGETDPILAWLESWVRDIVRLSLGNKSATLLENPDLMAPLQGLAEKLDLDKLLKIQRRFESVALGWRQANLNTQMQMERLLVDLVDSRR